LYIFLDEKYVSETVVSDSGSEEYADFYSLLETSK
jgi:hypothetical protein